MHYPKVIALLVAGAVLAGCSQPEPAPEPVPETSAVEVVSDGLPIDATPDVSRDSWEECPYLDTQWVADTNGQRMTALGVDERFLTPACVFWSYPDEPQLIVMVRTMADVEEARAVVDHFAPIESTQPAELAGGWQGGRGAIDGGAVFAVQKDNQAVVVMTNQGQSVKAEQVAQEVVANVGL